MVTEKSLQKYIFISEDKF